MNLAMVIAKLESRPRGLMLGAVFSAAILVRAGVIIAMPELGNSEAMDTQNYLSLARGLVESGRFSMWNQPSAYVAPGYPFFLAGIFKILGENLLAVKIIQMFLGAAAAALGYLLALRFTRPLIAWLAAFMMAVHPELAGVTGFIYSEALFVFLLTASLLLMARTMASTKVMHALQAGALFGLTTLCRGTTLYFPLLLLGLAMLASQRWLWLRLWLIFVVGMAAVMAPWAIRNYHHFGVFLPVATGSGDVFWTGNYLEFDGEYRYTETQTKLREIAGAANLITRDRLLMEDAKQRIFAAPLPHAWLFVRKIFRYWLRVYEDVPRGEMRQRNWLVFGALFALHYALLFFAVIGLRQCNWRNAGAKMLLAFVCYYTLVHAATLAVARYRIPLLPLISIVAATGIVWLMEKFSAKASWRPANLAGGAELDFPRERRHES